MNSTRPKTRKPYARFCGIDISKRKHMACIIDREGRFVVRSQPFNNDAEGFQRLRQRLDDAGGPKRVAIAMEATGHYWYSVHDFLMRQDYPVAVLNPIQTSRQARTHIRKSKTDKIDAYHIAVLLKNGQHRPALVPGEFAMTCRQVSRLRYAYGRQIARIKQLLWARIHPVWPEYEPLFANPFCETGRKLLWTAPTPADVLSLDPEELADLIRKTSRGKCGSALAGKVREAAARTVGTRRGLEGIRIAIRSLVAQLDALKPVRQQLHAEIERLADQLPGHILTLPGITPARAVSLFGETDPIETFRSPAQLVAFAGLDPVVFQTGQYEAPRQRISKRGSPFLRRTLWHMTMGSLQREGDLRDFWLAKRRQGLHHLAAVTATAIKLCHVAWRILTDRRDYLPQRPRPKP